MAARDDVMREPPAEWPEERREHWRRAAEVACQALGECRVQLMLKFRFLDAALWRMPFVATVPRRDRPLATDGSHIFFEPIDTVARYGMSADELVRDQLHLIMHCLFRHPYEKPRENVHAWKVACDIAAESAAMDVCAGRFVSDLDPKREVALAEFREACAALSAGTVYRELTEGPLGEDVDLETRLFRLERLFKRDRHTAWPACACLRDDSLPDNSNDAQEQVDAKNDESPEVATTELTPEEACDAPLEGDNMTESGDGDGTPLPSDEACGDDDSTSEDEHGDQGAQGDDEEEIDEDEWEHIAKMVETDLETFSQEWGDEAGELVRLLRVANAKRYDYTAFLRRFSTIDEQIRVSDDEFDYVLYTYGLSLFGDMPLIEPLEYRETHRLSDFVVAIDTSESCDGDKVRAFVEHTFALLKEQEGSGRKVNVHIVQCDSKVQTDTVIEDLGDIDALMEGFTIRGLGGTDFRPVFGYIEALRADGALPDLKGLVYFTDGLGTFPDKAPDYDAAFVFLAEEGTEPPETPPWAIRITIDDEGMREIAHAQGERGQA